MRFFSSVFTAIAIAAPALANPSPLRAVEKYDGKTSGRFIIKLKNGTSKTTVTQQLKEDVITHDWQILNGFAGVLTFDNILLSSTNGCVFYVADLDTDAVNSLRASPDIELLSEDGIMHMMTTQ